MEQKNALYGGHKLRNSIIRINVAILTEAEPCLLAKGHNIEISFC